MAGALVERLAAEADALIRQRRQVILSAMSVQMFYDRSVKT
jgi:hypothetical protein